MAKYKVEGRTFKVHIVVDVSKTYPKLLPDTEKEKAKTDSNIKIEWAEFLYWNWELASIINKEARNPDGSIDFIKLREAKLKYLLIDWSLEEDGKKIKIERKNKTLTPECLKEIKEIHPVILNAFLNKADLILELGEEEEDFFIKNSPPTGEQSTQAEKQG